MTQRRTRQSEIMLSRLKKIIEIVDDSIVVVSFICHKGFRWFTFRRKSSSIWTRQLLFQTNDSVLGKTLVWAPAVGGRQLLLCWRPICVVMGSTLVRFIDWILVNFSFICARVVQLQVFYSAGSQQSHFRIRKKGCSCYWFTLPGRKTKFALQTIYLKLSHYVPANEPSKLAYIYWPSVS